MIWRPKPGDRVCLRYRPDMREGMLHLATGTVEVSGVGPGPINAAVRLVDDGRRVVVPRGNLFRGDWRDSIE